MSTVEVSALLPLASQVLRAARVAAQVPRAELRRLAPWVRAGQPAAPLRLVQAGRRARQRARRAPAQLGREPNSRQ